MRYAEFPVDRTTGGSHTNNHLYWAPITFIPAYYIFNFMDSSLQSYKMISPFYRSRNWDSTRLSSSLKIMHEVNFRAFIAHHNAPFLFLLGTARACLVSGIEGFQTWGESTSLRAGRCSVPFECLEALADQVVSHTWPRGARPHRFTSSGGGKQLFCAPLWPGGAQAQRKPATQSCLQWAGNHKGWSWGAESAGSSPSF